MPNRQYRVCGPRETFCYEAFNGQPSGAKFKLVPLGRVEAIEGAFYCDEGDLEQACNELIRYELQVWDRRNNIIRVQLAAR